jgi:hypothetical protein
MENLLFIGPSFFGYEKDIKKDLSKRYCVYYKCEYPFGNPRVYYTIEHLFRFLVKYIWKRYNKSVLKLVKSKGIKKAFIIRGKHLSESLISTLVNEFGIEIVCYQWDSVKNNPNSLMLANYSTRIYTFDMEDSKNTPVFLYLPLFYSWRDDYCLRRTDQYDIFYLASYTTLRHDILKELRNVANNNGLTLWYKLYLPFILYLRMLVKGHPVPLKDVSFFKLSRKKYYYLLSNSKLSVDAPSPSQTGASMRTIETLSLKKKLITTNRNVMKEEFFSSDNIYFWPQDINRISAIVNSEFDEFSYNHIKNIPQWLQYMGV